MSNSNDIAGLREQIVANAIILFPTAVTESMRLFDGCGYYIPDSHSFDLVTGFCRTNGTNGTNGINGEGPPTQRHGYQALLKMKHNNNILARSDGAQQTVKQALESLLERTSAEVDSTLSSGESGLDADQGYVVVFNEEVGEVKYV